jgi:poly(3-hydroxybutyrate) depolymerase
MANNKLEDPVTLTDLMDSGLNDPRPDKPLSMKRVLILIAIAIVLVAAPAAVWYLAHYDWHRRHVMVDGVRREYLWYAPSSRFKKPLPLVLAYHGWKGPAKRLVDSSLLHELAESEGFYLAYIEGNPSWHCFTPWQSEVNPDIAMFDALRTDLVDRFPIDPHRIYAVGMSKGGDFVVHLGLRRSNELAAIVAQGACILEEQTADRPIPMLFIVGTEDGEVTTETMETVPQIYRDRGHLVEVIRPEGVPHRWERSLNDELWEFLSRQSLIEKQPADPAD